MLIVNGKRKVINVYKTKSLAPQTLAWESWVVARGGSVDPVILKKMNDYFFVPASQTNIFDKVFRLCVYQGVGNRTAATTNLIQNQWHAEEFNNPTWENNNGFHTPVGQTGYLDWMMNPLTSIPNANANFVVGLYIKNPLYNATYRVIGNRDSSRFGMVRSTGNNTAVYLNSTTPLSNALNFSIIGMKKFFFSINGTSGTNTTPGGTVPGTRTPTAWMNRNIYELTSNESQGLTAFDHSPHCISFIANNGVDLASLETILDNLLQQL